MLRHAFFFNFSSFNLCILFIYLTTILFILQWRKLYFVHDFVSPVCLFQLGFTHWLPEPNICEPIHKDSQRLSKRFTNFCESFCQSLWIASQILGSAGCIYTFRWIHNTRMPSYSVYRTPLEFSVFSRRIRIGRRSFCCSNNN